jgi:recombination endonuclease VII
MSMIDTLPTRQYSVIRNLRKRNLVAPASGQCEMSACYGGNCALKYDHCHIHDYIRGILCHSCNIMMIDIDARVFVSWKPAAFAEYWAHCPQCAMSGPWEPYITADEYSRAWLRELIHTIGCWQSRDVRARLAVIPGTDKLITELYTARQNMILTSLSMRNLRELRKLLHRSEQHMEKASYALPGSGESQNEAYQDAHSLTVWVARHISDLELESRLRKLRQCCESHSRHVGRYPGQ